MMMALAYQMVMVILLQMVVRHWRSLSAPKTMVQKMRQMLLDTCHQQVGMCQLTLQQTW